MLTSSNSEQVKTGLQRACDVIESGSAFLSVDFLRMGLAKHLTSTELKVRRWAYKLVALLDDVEYLPQLETALRGGETDPENRGWASAAYSGIGDRARVAKTMARVDDYHGSSMELASLLYAKGDPDLEGPNLQQWEGDPLARKWLCMLCGYAPFKKRTIDQRFDNLDLVRNSVGDDDPEIVEYSIWAEHRHPSGSALRLHRQPHELLAFPNVRRWLYRLLTKDEGAALCNLDLLMEKMSAAQEMSAVAREGLALGLANIRLPDARTETIDWFQGEPDPKVKLALTDHLALMANSNGDKLAKAVLIYEFQRCQPGDLLSAKILSIAQPDWGISGRSLPGAFNALTLVPHDLFGSDPTALQIPSSVTLNIQELTMGNKTTQIGQGNSMSGVVTGDMIASTMAGLSNQTDQSFPELNPKMERLLTEVGKSSLPDAEKKPVIDALDAVTVATAEEKPGKLATLRSVVRGLIGIEGLGRDLIEGGKDLVDAIGNVL